MRSGLGLGFGFGLGLGLQGLLVLDGGEEEHAEHDEQAARPQQAQRAVRGRVG